MAMIGAYGPVVFIASENTIRTFTNFTRNEKGRWAKHDVIMKKPILEFIGPDIGTISFNMRFDVSYGMKPKNEIDRLMWIVRRGEAHTLILGGVPIGFNKWTINSVDQNWEHFDNKGNLLVGEVTVSLEEYV